MYDTPPLYYEIAPRRGALHLQFGQLNEPRADIVITISMSQQKAIKPRTQDSQRNLI